MIWCKCSKCGNVDRIGVDMECEPPNLRPHPKRCDNCKHVYVRDRVNCPGKVYTCTKYGGEKLCVSDGRFVHADWSCDSWETRER
jgi:hypothetical protein